MSDDICESLSIILNSRTHHKSLEIKKPIITKIKDPKKLMIDALIGKLKTHEMISKQDTIEN